MSGGIFGETDITKRVRTRTQAASAPTGTRRRVGQIDGDRHQPAPPRPNGISSSYPGGSALTAIATHTPFSSSGRGADESETGRALPSCCLPARLRSGADECGSFNCPLHFPLAPRRGRAEERNLPNLTGAFRSSSASAPTQSFQTKPTQPRDGQRASAPIQRKETCPPPTGPRNLPYSPPGPARARRPFLIAPPARTWSRSGDRSGFRFNSIRAPLLAETVVGGGGGRVLREAGAAGGLVHGAPRAALGGRTFRHPQGHNSVVPEKVVCGVAKKMRWA